MAPQATGVFLEETLTIGHPIEEVGRQYVRLITAGGGRAGGRDHAKATTAGPAAAAAAPAVTPMEWMPAMTAREWGVRAATGTCP
jgi:hypothetical protein